MLRKKIKKIQVSCLSHDHTLFKDGNALVFEILVEALKGHQCHQQFSARKKGDRKKATTTLEEQHISIDIWVADIEKKVDLFEAYTKYKKV